MKEIIKHLESFATEERTQLFDRVIENRTKYLTVVLEDIFQAQNASAVLRSCDCFGIQDVHIIENQNEFCIHKEIVMGSTKWLDLHKYNKQENNTREAIRSLKAQGYRIVATTPHEKDVFLHDFDLHEGKAALVFGTELTGISDIVKEEADAFIKVPMYGFTESFNISVCASLVMQDLTTRIRRENVAWQLSEEEKEEIKYEWLKRSIRSADLIISMWEEKNKLICNT
ncbi:RNA methyltransferase [Halosquirtibacter xylanolyticus]|uniref:TrmH family RNA methyltransferase n=1 Tax=Halosquirtibacter xylanolyticus TaxID=3374599 RepID=UPI003749684A|nr:RNA methyltransferase [Prolixibacteraceae bacterium]